MTTIFFSAITAIFVLMLINDATSASYEYRAPTIVLDVVADNAVSREYPPVLACNPGYTARCVKDDIVVPPGEQQQYPPIVAANWLASLGCTDLTDVPLDDSRWADREDDEVFAQESDNCLSLYWPEGGEAQFDISVTLDSPATWHDYLLSGARPPRTGNFTIQSGKQRISFNASGTGGMTLFVTKDDVKPPLLPPGGFFTSYVNLQRDKLPANRIYPIGQRMMISWYNPTTPAEISNMHAHGFTAAGPWENAWGVGFDLDAVMKRVNELGMRSWLFMHMGESPNGKPLTAVYGVCDGLRSGMTPQEIGAKSHRTYNKYHTGDYLATVDALMHYPEEMAQRLNSCSRNQLLAVNNAVTDTLKKDWSALPFIKSETSTTALTNADFKAVHGRISAPIRQFYFSDQTNLDVIPHALNRHIKLYNNLKNTTTADRPAIDKRILGVIPDWTRDPASGDSNRYTDYYMTTALIKGVQSFSFAQYAHLQTPPHSPSQSLKRAWFNTVKKVTDCGHDKAFIWGTDNPPGGKLSFTRIDGPAKSVKYGLPTMLATERQYESSRYILLTNSHKTEAIKVHISGLPAAYKQRDCKTGSVSNRSGSMDVILQAWGSAIYKVSK